MTVDFMLFEEARQCGDTRASRSSVDYYYYIMVEVSLTVGKLDASLALLLTKDHHLIEFPTILLPNGVRAGSIVKIRCDRDLETEQRENELFRAIQDEILATFGKNLPQNPQLHVKNVTQTSCVLEWDPLDLGTASLKNLVLFKDGKKLGAIPQPLTNRTTKLSGLPIDKEFRFQLRLDTTAGVFSSESIDVHTHKMTDLSGITVCLGDISANEHFTVDDIQATLKNMGAHYPAQESLKVDTTHFITMRENKQNPEYLKANEMNIPIIRPEWLKACERERRIVGVRDFYVKDCALPDIYAKNYWQKAPTPGEAGAAEAAETGAAGTGASNEGTEPVATGEAETGEISETAEAGETAQTAQDSTEAEAPVEVKTAETESSPAESELPPIPTEDMQEVKLDSTETEAGAPADAAFSEVDLAREPVPEELDLGAVAEPSPEPEAENPAAGLTEKTEAEPTETEKTDIETETEQVKQTETEVEQVVQTETEQVQDDSNTDAVAEASEAAEVVDGDDEEAEDETEDVAEDGKGDGAPVAAKKKKNKKRNKKK